MLIRIGLLCVVSWTIFVLVKGIGVADWAFGVGFICAALLCIRWYVVFMSGSPPSDSGPAT